MCREDALEISSRFASGAYPALISSSPSTTSSTTASPSSAAGRVKLVGVIKEVAPVSGAETDEILGVGEFHSKYFGNHPLYIDKEHAFYKYFGGKSLLSQPLHSWNPFTLFRDFKGMQERLKTKGVEGNLKGEGLLKGGLLIINPKTQEIVYRHEEATGSEMPYDEIGQVLKTMVDA